MTFNTSSFSLSLRKLLNFPKKVHILLPWTTLNHLFLEAQHKWQLFNSYHWTCTTTLHLRPPLMHCASGRLHNLTAPLLIGLLTVRLTSPEDGHITGLCYHRLPQGSLVNRSSTSNVWPQGSRERRGRSDRTDKCTVDRHGIKMHVPQIGSVFSLVSTHCVSAG